VLASTGDKCDYRSQLRLANSDTRMHGNHQTINIESLLSHVPLFNGLAPDELARIARGTREINATRGDILFHKGDLSSGIHLIVYGQVKLAFTSPQGGEKVVDILSQGQSFGEAVMFMERPYMVYAQTLSDTLLLHIAKSVILEELENDPKLGRKMIAGLSMRLHHLITDVESYSLHSGRQRIIGYLLRDNLEKNQKSLTITLPTSKGVIASRLNLTQEHFSRILHELSEIGLIVVEGRKIHIGDVEKLRHYDL
jgi:CRP/FNR family transcriptional regulator, dissimilatory nitrate respiration regulator